jgi:hypothetical protein
MNYDPVFSKILFDIVIDVSLSSQLRLRSSWILISRDVSIYHNYLLIGSKKRVNNVDIEADGRNDGFSDLELERLLEVKYRNDEKLKNHVISLRQQLTESRRTAVKTMKVNNNDSNLVSCLSLFQQLQLKSFATIK